MAATNMIVNADDFGLSRDISDAIARGHDRGVITSTTLMATAPATEYAASLAKLRPELGVGIHLNITTGRPLIDPARLPGLVTADGRFLGPGRIARRLSFDPRLIGPIAGEYSRQVEKCLDLGITPTHCDTHHGMHRFPVVFEAFQRTLMRYRIKAARSQAWLAIQAKPAVSEDGGSTAIGFRRDHSARGAWKRLCALRMRASGIRTPDAQLRADLDSLGSVSPVEWFDFLLCHAPRGTFEIVLHPGMPEEGELIPNGFVGMRRRDTAVINQSNRPGDRLSGRSIRFISYAELARVPR